VREAFSIFAAAREAPRRVGLHIGGRALSFDELAERTRERLKQLEAPPPGRPFVLIGPNALDTLLTLYALLERRIPALLLHPASTAVERDALLAGLRGQAPTLPADAAAILFTSGTTGTPRGAVLTQANLLASARASAANLGWQDDDCWQMCMPVARVGGLSIVTRCLAARRAVAVPPAFDAASWPQWLAGQRVTISSLVPTMLAKVLDAHPQWRAPAALRALLIGGAAAPQALLARAHAAGVPVIATYGMTEACSHVVATPYALRHRATIGAGRVLPGAQLRIVDGHIQIRGPMLMHGYVGQPPRGHDAWFDSGDLGELDAEGFLHVHARRTDLIVTGGDNVYPAEVERVLEACPGIAAATVLGLPDPTWGQTVAALLVAAGDGAPAPATLASHIEARLSPHKRPRRIAWVERLPLTAAGKPDRSPAVAEGRAWQALKMAHR
jgi:O-succinylbenzoic acid--CoA ligase